MFSKMAKELETKLNNIEELQNTLLKILRVKLETYIIKFTDKYSECTYLIFDSVIAANQVITEIRDELKNMWKDEYKTIEDTYGNCVNLKNIAGYELL